MIYNGDHDGEYDLRKKKKMARRKKREREREEIQFPRSYIEWQASWRTTPDLNN